MSNHSISRLHVDKSAGIPIYQQIQLQLEQLIASGTWRLKEPLPSETALAEQLGISVMTVRQAMAQLVNKGLIYREKGRGTFVTPQPLDHHLHRLESFTEDMHARSMEPTSETLTCEIIPVPLRIAPRLGLKNDARVLHLKRLRLVDQLPVALHDAYVTRTDLSCDLVEELGSLYMALERLGVTLMEGDEMLEAVAADMDTARHLDVKPGAPLLKATRITWDVTHNPIEYVIATYRADFYRYNVRLRR